MAKIRVVAFESRRATEIAELIRRFGGEPLSAPSMREVPLDSSPAVADFARRLAAREIDAVIFLTGVGTRLLLQAIPANAPSRLSEIATVARGPKPLAALREVGVRATIAVPEPNTWRELLAALDDSFDVAGKRVAIQEYGEENPDLVSNLEARGATVLRVPIYRWALPEDLRPLENAIHEILGGGVDGALFTSATQVEHLFQVAGVECAAKLADALSRITVGSIGPIASAALERHGIRVELEPEHPKMGALVRDVLERLQA